MHKLLIRCVFFACMLKIVAMFHPRLYSFSRWAAPIKALRCCWSQSLQSVKGVGPKYLEILNAHLKLQTIGDLLLHLPAQIIDRTKVTSNVTGKEGGMVTSRLRCVSSEKSFPHRAMCVDDGGAHVNVSYYLGRSKFAYIEWNLLRKKVFRDGEAVLVSGKLYKSRGVVGTYEYANPDYAFSVDDQDSIFKFICVEPVYHLASGITNLKMRALMSDALEKLSVSKTKEWIDPGLLSSKNWPSFNEALRYIHSPSSENYDKAAWMRARERLAFEELVSLQLQHLQREKTYCETIFQCNGNDQMNNSAMDYSCTFSGQLSRSALSTNRLGYVLTPCQVKAMQEISEDLRSNRRMIRLVQGDVGSGKTAVAFHAILNVLESGGTAILLAPTEILAKQHFSRLQQLLSEASPNETSSKLNAGLFTGEVKGVARSQLLEQVRNRTISVLVGTHALLQGEVLRNVPELKLVVIDEEQRFGAAQREVISTLTNVLYTTATPIPRSLALLLSTDCGISTLRTQPPKNRNIITEAIPREKLEEKVLNFLKENVILGSKVFWVCPSVNSTIKYKESSATARFEQLSSIFPGQVGLIHGKMTGKEKEDVMTRFAQRDSVMKILVSTTVIEVGVDVPDVSICVIDRAEMFGLSQLHQIRGRIGRGDPPTGEALQDCRCFLVYDSHADSVRINTTVLDEPQAANFYVNTANSSIPASFPSTPAGKRFEILCNSSNDCFALADFDLAMRGPGDVFGFRQHANITYRAARMPDNLNLLPIAHQAACQIINGSYPGKLNVSDQRVQDLLQIFRDRNIPDSFGVKKEGSSELSSSSGGTGKTTEIQNKSVEFRSIEVKEVVEPCYVVIDLESTGLDTSKDRIIQLAAKVVGSSDCGFSQFVKPEGVAVPPFIENLTGITQAKLDAEGVTFTRAWNGLLDWLKTANGENKPIVLIAHNGTKFDFPFLANEVVRAMASPEFGLQLSAVASFDSTTVPSSVWFRMANLTGLVDTLTLFRHEHFWNLSHASVSMGTPLKSERSALGVGRSTSPRPSRYSLGALYSHFFPGHQIVNAHNATGDVLALEKILCHELVMPHWKKIASAIQIRY